MKGAVDRLLCVRPGPRPDPLPERPGPAWRVHAPWAVVLLAAIAAALLLGPRDLGFVAAGAGVAAIAIGGLQGRIRDAALAFHFAGGVVLIALFDGAEAGGGIALPMGLLLAASLAGGAAAKYVSPAVAPLPGAMPWRFEDAYRQQALVFAVCGLGASLAVVAMGPTPFVRVLGVALLPLSLRVYNGQLLSPSASRSVWLTAAAANALLLVVLGPLAGAPAAALGVLAAEAILAVGSTLEIARRTGAALVPKPKLVLATGAILLLGPLAVPSGAVWLLVTMLVAGAVYGMLRATRLKS